MTGAASDALAAQLGADDGCCGSDGPSGGCGKCLLVQNKDAVNADWKVVVMKKSRCPPESYGCDKPHFDLAVPGFDNYKYSLANVCGMETRDNSVGWAPQESWRSEEHPSYKLGNWYTRYSDATQAEWECDLLPVSMRPGCRLFTRWGWRSGDPKLHFEAVPCPDAYVKHMEASFGFAGPGSPHLQPATLPSHPPAQPPPALFRDRETILTWTVAGMCVALSLFLLACYVRRSKKATRSASMLAPDPVRQQLSPRRPGTEVPLSSVSQTELMSTVLKRDMKGLSPRAKQALMDARAREGFAASSSLKPSPRSKSRNGKSLSDVGVGSRRPASPIHSRSNGRARSKQMNQDTDGSSESEPSPGTELRRARAGKARTVVGHVDTL